METIETTSDAGIALIKRFEGKSLKAYQCPAGIWTIGYGHTSAAGAPEVKPAMLITEREADAILRNDLHKVEAQVAKLVKVELSREQFSALVSFAYNVGAGAFASSSVLKAVNSRRFDLVPSRLALWNKANGKVLPGLTKRRAAEAALFASSSEFSVEDAQPNNGKVSPSRGKPVLASTTNIAAGGMAIAGVTSTISQVTYDLNNVKEAIGPNVFAIALGSLLVLGAAYIIYERYNKSKYEGV